jgi:hypothetical protein
MTPGPQCNGPRVLGAGMTRTLNSVGKGPFAVVFTRARSSPALATYETVIFFDVLVPLRAA